jgi:hypothetical protein
MLFRKKTESEFRRDIQKQVDAYKEKGRNILGSRMVGYPDGTAALTDFHLDGTQSISKNK